MEPVPRKLLRWRRQANVPGSPDTAYCSNVILHFPAQPRLFLAGLPAERPRLHREYSQCFAILSM